MKEKKTFKKCTNWECLTCSRWWRSWLFWHRPQTTLSPPTKISCSIQKHLMQSFSSGCLGITHYCLLWWLGRPGKELGFHKQVMKSITTWMANFWLLCVNALSETLIVPRSWASWAWVPKWIILRSHALKYRAISMF